MSNDFIFLSENELKEGNPHFIEGDSTDLFDGEPDPYDEARIFLCGSCHLFALALQQKYGYQILQLGESIHYFCQATYGNQKVYIDVRGITDDIEKIKKTFSCEETPQLYTQKEPLSSQERHGFEFAQWIIQQHPERYYVPGVTP